LSFVVQKHWASSLHYDLRLELDGTLKSWALPKGPSFDPKDKRMAVQVEDHPLAYAGFEGTVPAKQYGAGKIIVWDTGIWRPLGDPRQAYLDGHLKFELQGHKLLGKWALVRIKGRSEKQAPWLLIKEKDAQARPSHAYSVVDELPDSVRSELPDKLCPQLATPALAPPQDAADWIFEIKFDGYRMLVRQDAQGPRLITRNGHDWTSKLRSLQAAITGMNLPDGWYDGEIVLAHNDGVPDFGALQQSFDSGHTDGVVLYLFDLPYFDGQDLRELPLDRRRAVLQKLLLAAPSDRVRFSKAFDAAPEGIVAAACKLGLEGIIAKRRSSRYQSSRSMDWIKLKCGLRQEFVIGGYTDPQGTRSGFGALLLGVHDAHGALQYAGKVGSGFSQTALAALTRTLTAQTQANSPFSGHAAMEDKPRWVAPTLVAEVSFGAWTRAAHIRHAVFRGLRADTDASAIVREKALPVQSGKLAKALGLIPVGATPRYPQITHPQRVIDTSTGTTKMDLVRYYGIVGPLMMPHLQGRQVSLVRAPDGVDGPQFFQKHTGTEKLPGIRQRTPVLTTSQPAVLEIISARGLLSAAQWNVIELHTLNTGAASPEHPDRMVFDLDPGEAVPWAHVQEAAQLMHAFLAQLGLPSFLKTSGGKGLHVVVPVRKLHDWDTVKGFSQAIVLHMAQTIPQRFVAKSGPRNRVGKVFIDYLRNSVGATTVCAWSARARPGLGISVPVAWSDLSSLRGGNHWSVKTVHERLDAGNAPWKDYAKSARSLTGAMATLGYNLPPAAPSAAISARRSKAAA